ncbi:MAG: amino acid-binding protein [Halobacteriota archaeon]
MSDAADASEVQTHTVRLELVDEPGELLRALEPISENGGNLMSIYHERGNLTPRGHIPVEVDFSCTAHRFETIVDALRDAGVNVMQAGTERYDEELTVLLVGHIVDTDLSDTLQRIEACANASLDDLSLSGTNGTDEPSSALLRLAARSGATADVLGTLRTIADEKDLHLIEPLTEVSG